MSYSDLARAMNRAESTVRERVAELEHGGVIKGYRADVDASRVGLRIRAVLRADCALANVSDLTHRLMAVPQVHSARLTTGAKPLVIEVMVENLDQLARIVETRLAPLGLTGVEMSVVLENLLPARSIPIPVTDASVIGRRRPALATASDSGTTVLNPLRVPDGSY